LEQVGFFVPGYLEDPNAWWAQSMPNVEVMQLLTIGFDYAIQHVPRTVTLCNAKGVHEQSTAELAIGMIISHWRGIDAAVRSMDTGTWNHTRGRSLQESSAVVVGAGGVGARIAGLLEGLGARVSLVGRTTRPGVIAMSEINSVMATADVVVLAVPLTEETLGMVNKDFLAQLPDGALLVNVARGPVVNTEALVAELNTGRISAALDVVDPEPLPTGHPLWSAPNVLITPHVGGDSDAFPRLVRRLIIEQVKRWRAGEPLANVIVSPGEHP
jgi:phosphoglycerate dehydrogenase-like enzyme